jgi:large subunit ribosomal protein L29
MADKKKAPIQEKSQMGAKELAVELRTALASRARLEFTHKVSPLKNPLELRHVRREIARLKTHLRQAESKAATPAAQKKTVKEAAK